MTSASRILADNQQSLSGLESTRLVVKAKAALTRNINILIGIATGALIIFMKSGFPIVFGIIAMSLLYYRYVRKYKKPFAHSYKEIFLQKIIKTIDPNLNYKPLSKISVYDFKQGQIYKNPIDRYSGEDLIEGKIGETSFRLSEIEASTVTEDKDGKSSVHTFFDGLYFIGGFNKNFKATTVVLPDFYEAKLGLFGQFLQNVGGKIDSRFEKIIRLEDPEFEKSFIVYSSDPVEARYILTPSLMKRILELKKLLSQNIALSFVNSEIHIAIKTKKDYFEPTVKTSLFDTGHIAEFIEDIQFSKYIIEELNLNTRIWA